MTQMTLVKSFLTAAVAGGIALSANAQVIVDEDFEGYADTAAMLANWGGGGLGTLDTALGNPGQSAMHPGGAVNIWQGSFSLTPTDAAPIVLRGQIFDTAQGSAQRNMIGLRTGTSPLFEMGHYNGQSSQYAIRVNAFAGGEGYLYFEDVVREEGWHTYTATFTETTVTVTLDLHSDGIVDSTLVSTGSNPIGAFSDLRFGGPSGNSSANPMWVDNIRLEVIPEPSTYAAIFGGLALVGAFVYRRRVSAKK